MFGILEAMKIRPIPCGSLRVDARKMHNNILLERITSLYALDPEGNMRIAMNALLVDSGSEIALFDPGCADFLPSRFLESYGLEIPVSLEETLKRNGYDPGDVTDVIFTHLHFDHGSGAFAREPGRICKRFPNASYRVLRAHWEYARRPSGKESSSYMTGLFKYLDRIDWLDEWNREWLQWKIFHGHTRFMTVPGIRTPEGASWFVSDLIPLVSFLQQDVCSEYDLEPDLARREKGEFLAEISAGSELIFYHDPLKERIFYP